MNSRNSYALLLGMVLMPSTTYASLYSITYYELIESVGTTLSDYQVSGTGTFEINNPAVNPNSTVLYEDPDFVSLQVNLTTTVGNATFSLANSDFPTGDTFAGPEQGILFDNFAVPLRFDTPSTAAGNTAIFCNPTCNEIRVNREAFWMWDDDGYERVLLADGTITDLSALPPNTDYTLLGGDWDFSPFGSISQIGGFYQISNVPVPGAAWLFASGLLGLIGISRRKKVV